MPCSGIPAAAVFGPVPAASYPCGTTGDLGGQRGEQTFQGSKYAAKQMCLMQEEEPEVLPCMRAALPAVGTSPGELPASSGPTRVPWAPVGGCSRRGSGSAGAGAVPCLHGDGRSRGPSGLNTLMLFLCCSWRHHYQTGTIKTQAGLGKKGGRRTPTPQG